MDPAVKFLQQLSRNRTGLLSNSMEDPIKTFVITHRGDLPNDG